MRYDAPGVLFLIHAGYHFILGIFRIPLKVGGYDSSGVGTRLSNFTKREFYFDDVKCKSIEGVLQSLKIPDHAKQLEVCQLVGGKAKRAGKKYNNWKENQVLYWKGIEYKRDSSEYATLIKMIFHSAKCDYIGNEPYYMYDIIVTANRKMTHSIGSDDPTDTVLTEDEFINILYELRDTNHLEYTSIKLTFMTDRLNKK
jgi:hypothetical protein